MSICRKGGRVRGEAAGCKNKELVLKCELLSSHQTIERRESRLTSTTSASSAEMYRTALVTLAALLCSSALVNGGKVLVFPIDGSHWVNMKVLIEELHSRGHEITVLVPLDTWYIKLESPHYKTIALNASAGFDKERFGSFCTKLLNLRRQGASIWARMSVEYELMVQFTEMNKKVLHMMGEIFDDDKMMQSFRDAKYDLLLTDPAVGGGVLLGHRLGLPLVFNVRWTIQGEGHQAIAPTPLSYVPIPGAELTDKMTFTQRLKNFLCYLFTRFQIACITDSTYKPFVHRYFGSDVHYMELFQAADIWLMRNDFTFEFPRPTMPNVVYMSGFQCKPSKPLPTELEEFVQSSGEHGIIVMTLGTLVAQLPEDITEAIAAAFAQLPQKVIWRHKGKRPSTLGNNTLLLDWLPQNDLLGHPKTRLFVAHGGTNGMQEAIYHGVPLVGVPLMFDQPDNFSRMKARGVAKVVDIATLDKDNFLEAVKEVLYEPSYREKMKTLSNIHRDQPMKPLDRAIFWIEFVMRHKGAPHLRTESYKMSAIQYYLIDVVAFLLAVTLLALTFLSVQQSFYGGECFVEANSKDNSQTDSLEINWSLGASPARTHPLLSAVRAPGAGRRASGGAEGCLQVAERQRPVHRPVDLSSAPPAQSCPAAHIEVNQGRYGVEGLALQAVLDPGVSLTRLNHRLLDEEVKRLLLPAVSKDEVARTGLRVSDEEVAVVQHQTL
ncbi:hypothetical protein INR49_019271 [Caranx melampygus]|nr:hypothetical protein INR49_019271 [Caranx melampygus]